MSGEELLYYWNLLEQKRMELEQKVRRLDGIVVERLPDAVEDVRVAGDREVAISTLDRESVLLAQVRRALAHMREGTYGVCEACNDPIRSARLAALPWAAHCIRCQQAIDAQQESRQAASEFFAEGDEAA